MLPVLIFSGVGLVFVSVTMKGSFVKRLEDEDVIIFPARIEMYTRVVCFELSEW